MTKYIGAINDFLTAESEGGFLPTHQIYISPVRDEILVVTHVESVHEFDDVQHAAVGVSGRDDFLVLLTAPHGETTRHVRLFRKGASVYDAPLTLEQFGTSLQAWLEGSELAFV